MLGAWLSQYHLIIVTTLGKGCYPNLANWESEIQRIEWSADFQGGAEDSNPCSQHTSHRTTDSWDLGQ